MSNKLLVCLQLSRQGFTEDLGLCSVTIAFTGNKIIIIMMMMMIIIIIIIIIRPVETGGWGDYSLPPPPRIFATVDLLPNDSNIEKKKSIVETYKPF